MEKQYIYIVQASTERTRCKIGKTNDLESRLRDYNNMTGKSKDTIYKYLFTCEVKDMTEVENAIKNEYLHLREEKSKEVYFYNSIWFETYVNFIKSHELFIKMVLRAVAKQSIIDCRTSKEARRTHSKTPPLKDRGLTKKDVLQKAQKIRNDEFFTRYEDIEKELSMYDKTIWKDKVVFCNCDDAVGDEKNQNDSSPFSLYFLQNFIELGLKKLICTHYKCGVYSGLDSPSVECGVDVDISDYGEVSYQRRSTNSTLHSQHSTLSRGYIFTKDGFREIKEYVKNYTGSFDDPLSLKILNEEADIVCTNPPFSRGIDYWNIIIKSNKKFIIISNIANVLTTAYIPYFKNKQVWAGYNEVDWFLTPKKQLTRAAGFWYTNIPIVDRPRYKQLKIIPLKDIPNKYKTFDDNGMLLVANCYIPSNFTGHFAVSSRPILNGLLENGYKIVDDNEYYPYIKGKRCFARVLVQKCK